MKELLTCPICSKEFQSLNSHIHFKHQLTTEQFLQQYPNTKLVSDQIKKLVSKTCKKSGCGKWMKGYEYPEWRIKQYQEKFSGEGNMFYGKKHSKKTRKQMSDNHADFTGDKNPLVKWLNEDPQNKEMYSHRMREVWQNERNYKIVCERNHENAKKMMLNGNHHPYSNCEHGWFHSERFGNFYFQSSYEKAFLEFCESSDKVRACQRLPFIIPYKDENGKKRSYYADFLINQNVVIEIKAKSMLDYNHNREKIKAANKFCQKNGYEYKLLTEKELKLLDTLI